MRRRSMTAVTWLIILGVGLTWLMSMAVLTLVTAQELYDRLFEESVDFAAYVDTCGGLSRRYDKNFSAYGNQYSFPDYFEHSMLSAISLNTEHRVYSPGHYPGNGDRSKLIRDISYPMETAVLFYDGSGRLLHSSDDDVLFFGYLTQQEWDEGLDTYAELHYGWIDISEGKNAEDWHDDPYLRFRTMFAGTRELRDLTLRMTGKFDGTEFHPVSIYYVTYGQIAEIAESDARFSDDGGYVYYESLVSAVDKSGKLDWQVQFDNASEYPEDGLVTVYAEYPQMWEYEKRPAEYEGVRYESLASLARSLDFPSWGSDQTFAGGVFNGMGSYELNDLLVFGCRKYADYEGYDYSSGGEPETELYMVTAIRSHPLSCAVSALRNIYIFSAVAALILVLAVRGSIGSRLVAPVSEVADAMNGGWSNIPHSEAEPTPWREAKLIRDGYENELDIRRGTKNEVARLNAALDYAKNAERNRRAMVSAIAHELKTPLAVIHGYAEGLKEHIAEDKRDRYLDMILSESERTDAMVAELLDLSRLEAGRVKLSRDEFSLTMLVSDTLEKLSVAADAKGLSVSFDPSEDVAVVADEGRLAQVVENLLSNAVKYTDRGGSIRVGVVKSGNSVSFTVANTCPPLSAEALGKVWDTFYRADESRSGGGTGLGLAIAKNIIDLHGGRCSVRNTERGVKFGFSLPCN